MKNLRKTLQIALLSAFALAAAPAARAQINVNISSPNWGPAVSAGQQYYYIPETNGFYDVPARQYVVRRDGRWIRTSTLSGYNTANFHPVIVDYVGAQPWTRYDEYRGKYGKKSNPSNGGLPPGQAKKLYKKGYRYDDRRYDDRRDDRRDNDRRDEYRDRNEHRDHDRYEHDYHGKNKGKGKGKGKKDKD